MKEPQRMIGGQAVLEGVMMRCGKRVAVAVRRPDGTIHVEEERRSSWADRHKWLALPVLRGSTVLIESMLVGYQALNRSANLSDDEEEELTRWQLAGTLLFSLLFAAGLFILLPMFVTEWLVGDAQGVGFAAVEGAIRIGLFALYIGLLSRLQDIGRLFQYHGAEHKTINCFEAGERLTVENVRRHTMIHKRCGTSFLLFVMLIAIVLFSLFSAEGMSLWEMVLYRLLSLPLVAGLSYELIRWSGGSRNPLVGWLAGPGMWMQRMTTREPDDSMIEVAIASVRAVLDLQDDEETFEPGGVTA